MRICSGRKDRQIDSHTLVKRFMMLFCVPKYLLVDKAIDEFMVSLSNLLTEKRLIEPTKSSYVLLVVVCKSLGAHTSTTS